MQYEILEEGRAIRCKACGRTSWNQNDVFWRYCGHCNVFHDRPDQEACAWCLEPLLPGEELSPVMGNVKYHWACGLRSVAGGLNHQKGACSCCGGAEDPDPPELTRREAAEAAAKYWLLHNKQEGGLNDAE